MSLRGQTITSIVEEADGGELDLSQDQRVGRVAWEKEGSRCEYPGRWLISWVSYVVANDWDSMSLEEEETRSRVASRLPASSRTGREATPLCPRYV